MKTRWIVVALALAAVVGLGCNGILATPDPRLRETDAGDAAASDAATDGDASSPLCCGASCSDGVADPANCGACGHQCLGAACVESKCQPALLAGSPVAFRKLKSLYGLVAIGDTLYGTDWYMPLALVYSTPKRASVTAPDALFPARNSGMTADGAALAIATDDASLFISVFAASGSWLPGVWSVDFSGAGQRVISSDSIAGLAVDGSYLYWTNSTTTGLHVSTKTGAFVADIGTGTSAGSPLTAANGHVYFLRGGALFGATPPSGADAVLLSGPTRVDAFAVDSQFAYWADGVGRKVFRGALGGGAAPVDITPVGGIDLSLASFRVLVDDRFVYCATFNDIAPALGRLLRIRKDGSSSTADTMVSINDGFGALTQDSEAVYYTTSGNDSPNTPPYAAVWKIAK